MLFCLDLNLARCHNFVHALLELLIVNTVVIEVHELEQTESLFWVFLQHHLDDILGHFSDWDIAWESQLALTYLLLCLVLVVTPEG